MLKKGGLLSYHGGWKRGVFPAEPMHIPWHTEYPPRGIFISSMLIYPQGEGGARQYIYIQYADIPARGGGGGGTSVYLYPVCWYTRRGGGGHFQCQSGGGGALPISKWGRGCYPYMTMQHFQNIIKCVVLIRRKKLLSLDGTYLHVYAALYGWPYGVIITIANLTVFGFSCYFNPQYISPILVCMYWILLTPCMSNIIKLY